MGLKPNYPDSVAGIAWIKTTHLDSNLREVQEAVRLAERASESTKNQSEVILDTLAAAYAAVDQFDHAVKIAQAALQLASRAKADELANRIRKRLELYREGKSYRESVVIPKISNGTPSVEE